MRENIMHTILVATITQLVFFALSVPMCLHVFFFLLFTLLLCTYVTYALFFETPIRLIWFVFLLVLFFVFFVHLIVECCVQRIFRDDNVSRAFSCHFFQWYLFECTVEKQQSRFRQHIKWKCNLKTIVIMMALKDTHQQKWCQKKIY